jgi:hypothetical protein
MYCKTELSRQMLDINLSVASSMSPRIKGSGYGV